MSNRLRNMCVFLLLGPLVPVLIVFIIVRSFTLNGIVVGIVVSYFIGLIPAVCACFVFNRLQFSVAHLKASRRLLAGAVVGAVSGVLGAIPYALISAGISRETVQIVSFPILGAVAGAVCGIVLEIWRSYS